jgi:hypothetical protein
LTNQEITPAAEPAKSEDAPELKDSLPVDLLASRIDSRQKTLAEFAVMTDDELYRRGQELFPA